MTTHNMNIQLKFLLTGIFTCVFALGTWAQMAFAGNTNHISCYWVF